MVRNLKLIYKCNIEKSIYLDAKITSICRYVGTLAYLLFMHTHSEGLWPLWVAREYTTFIFSYGPPPVYHHAIGDPISLGDYRDDGPASSWMNWHLSIRQPHGAVCSKHVQLGHRTNFHVNHIFSQERARSLGTCAVETIFVGHWMMDQSWHFCRRCGNAYTSRSDPHVTFEISELEDSTA